MVMLASWYDRQGPAADVLEYGELPDPVPAAGEVRVRLTVSGVNPGDTKKRRGWQAPSMPFPRVVPHSDGAGVVDAVGPGVDETRVGQRVWVYGAQSYRPLGTAAQMTTVPEHQAVPCPDALSDHLGACLGIPGITAHRAVFADGPVRGKVVLVHGVLGGVGSIAAQLARWGGGSVIGTVRDVDDVEKVSPLTADVAVSMNRPNVAAAVRRLAPAGVDRIIEVSLSDNADFDASILAPDGTIAAYGSRNDRPQLPFWPMLFDNITIRLLGSDDFPTDAKQQASADLTTTAASGVLRIPIAARLPLREVAASHDLVDSGVRGRVVIDIP